MRCLPWRLVLGHMRLGYVQLNTRMTGVTDSTNPRSAPAAVLPGQSSDPSVARFAADEFVGSELRRARRREQASSRQALSATLPGHQVTDANLPNHDLKRCSSTSCRIVVVRMVTAKAALPLTSAAVRRHGRCACAQIPRTPLVLSGPLPEGCSLAGLAVCEGQVLGRWMR